MAAVDKIYGSVAQYDELYTWCKNHRIELLQYFYPRDSLGGWSATIACFPMEADIWLYEKCPISWVHEAIHYQYDGNPKGASPPCQQPGFSLGKGVRPWNVSRRKRR